ncbi:hypothetical protein R1sor_016591 [Riccia sorocarpa]|uniref:non-specific serine/threonine protein kinase n=1 Tax=Riccia sorocarpa TaxID=122646 RepID=A0ABD3HIQ8_9MARC
MATQLLCCTERQARLQNPVTKCNIIISVLVLSSLSGVCKGLPIQPFGYINIDCGGESGHGYNDTLTGLAWVGDEDYLQADDWLTREKLTFSSKVVMNDSSPASRNNAKQLETAKIFIFRKSQLNSYTKYCYRFNISLSNENSSSYLVRATFPPRNISNSPGVPNVRTSPIFYLGMDSSHLPVVPDDYEPVIVELLATSLGDSMDICLMPDKLGKINNERYGNALAPGMYNVGSADAIAAMSSLEVRSIPETLYPVFDNGKFLESGRTMKTMTNYYVTVSRLNFGGNESSPAIRYPFDKYDRLWYAAPRDSYLWETGDMKQYDWYVEPDHVYVGCPGRTMVPIRTDPRSEFKVKSINYNTVSIGSSTNDSFQVPYAVWASAWEGVNLNSTISFDLGISSSWIFRIGAPFCLNMVLFDINANMSRSRSVNISNTDEDLASEWILQEAEVPRNQPYIWADRRFGFFPYLFYEKTTFEIDPAASSALPVMINALELYGVLENVPTKTYSDDDSSVRILLDSLPNSVQIDSFGDPCLPVPWYWVKCLNADGYNLIVEINLNSQGLQGHLTEDLEVPVTLAVLDLSNNSFYGTLPRIFVNLTVAEISRISTVETRQSLHYADAWDLSDNNFSGAIPEFNQYTEVLNLSSNNMSGNFPCFSCKLTAIRILDLSHNSFDGPIPAFPNRSLEVLNLSSNHLSGSINLVSSPDLVGSDNIQYLVYNKSGLQPLRALRLENNNFSGMIPDDIWSSESQLETVDLSNNSFTELNLTSWTQSLLALKNDSFNGRQQVNLINNKIRSVIFAGADAVLESKNDEDMYRLLKRTPGYILLGKNNEWCTSSKLSRARVLKAYLCQDKDSGDDYYFNLPLENASSKRTMIISLGVSGSVFLVIVCILLVILMRIWKRMENLRQIQEELAKENVTPPFYKYEELRAATNYFSKENELGKGGFGAVYKAHLADKSIVAVKLLYPTEQNLADFLKETVLITGIKHRHLVTLKGCCVRDKKRILVYEFAQNGNLAQALWGNGESVFLSWTQRLKICVDVAKGLSYLHEELKPKIIHRDIKPDNILLDRDWNAKIADFGLARYVEGDDGTNATRIQGTRGYVSPEYAQGLITEKLDVFSFGILLLEIVSGRKCIDPSAPANEYYLRDWAFTLYRAGCLSKMAEEPLLQSVPVEEIETVLKIALSCLQERYENRPSMSKVITLLAGNATSAATDILQELRDQQYALHGSLFEPSTLSTVSEALEAEEEVLLELTSMNSSQFHPAQAELTVSNHGR